MGKYTEEGFKSKMHARKVRGIILVLLFGVGGGGGGRSRLLALIL